MSLEQALIDNTAAIRELIAAISNGIPTTAQQVAAVVEEAESKKSADTATAQDSSTAKKTSARASAAKTETPKQEVAATPEPKEEAAPAADDAPAVTYQDAAAAITALSKAKGRDAAVALLKKFGASKLPEVKEEDFAAIVADATAQVGA